MSIKKSVIVGSLTISTTLRKEGGKNKLHQIKPWKQIPIYLIIIVHCIEQNEKVV